VDLRELAKRAGVDPGYTSRIVEVLNRDALVVRTALGRTRRFSGGTSRGTSPRAVMHRLPRSSKRFPHYSVSGSWAATQFAPVAPTRLWICYADDPEALARELDLRPTEAGENVTLVTAYDPIVYERTSRKNGVTVAALSQIAVDLLTSPGRGPNEGDALIEWMRANEDVWRA
jgi:hypothetical protein